MSGIRLIAAVYAIVTFGCVLCFAVLARAFSRRPTLRCRRCGHKWTARVRMPVKCPRCQTWHWQQVAGRRRQPNGGGN